MPRDYNVCLRDMLEAPRKVQRYVGAHGRQALDDEKTLDAIARNLEIIGEAAKQVPHYIGQEHGDVPWAGLAGLRDLLIHQCFGIDLDILCNIVEDKFPELEREVAEILESA